MSEKVDNKERLFGSQSEYFPLHVEDLEGNLIPALLTRSQLEVAIKRASKNKEDVPKRSGFLSFIFG
jgi:hypothetical protein